MQTPTLANQVLSCVPTAVLRAEIQRREEEAKEKRNQALEKKHNFVVDNVDTLLSLAEHTCKHSDNAPLTFSENYSYDSKKIRCLCCALLDIKASQRNRYDLIVDLTARIQNPE